MRRTVVILATILALCGLASSIIYRIHRSGSRIKAVSRASKSPVSLAYLSVLQSGQVLARVGSTEVRGVDVRDALQLDFHGQPIHGSLLPSDLAQRIEDTLDRVVEDELLAQTARQQGFNSLESGALARQDMANQLINSEKAKLPEIADNEIRSFYKNHGERFYIPPGVNVRELFLPVSTLADDRIKQLEQSKKLAESLAERLRRGEAAETLASEFIPEPFRERAKGYLFKGGVLNEADENSILKLKPGEVIGPIRVEGGVSVFQGISQERARLIPFYEARDKIKSYLESNRSKELRQTLIEKAKQRIKVERFTPGAMPMASSKS